MRRAPALAILSVVALGLLALLFARTGATPGGLAEALGRLPAGALAAVVLFTALNLAAGTWKWLATLAALAPAAGRPRFLDAMTATALGALLGQVMPVQLGVALTRSLAARLCRDQRAGAALAATAYEQLFDGLVLAAAAGVGLAGVLLQPGPVPLLLAAAVGVAATAYAARKLCRGLGAALHRAARAAPWQPLRRRLAPAADLAARASRLPPRAVAAVLLLSVARYALLLARALVVLAAVGLAAQAPAAALGFPLVQLAAIVPLTPGNLGVVEWTWAAMLAGLGAELGAAALFALVFRLVTVAAQLAVLAGLAALLGLARAFPARRARPI